MDHCSAIETMRRQQQQEQGRRSAEWVEKRMDETQMQCSDQLSQEGSQQEGSQQEGSIAAAVERRSVRSMGVD